MRLLLLLGTVWLAGCGDSGLPSYGVVPEFTLTAQDGKAFSSSQLSGKIWVADFIFTNCPGVCPRLSTQLKQVVDSVRERTDVRFVSFTVDPARDTPQVLEAYAKRYKAPADRWFFLTGPQPDLNKLARYAFLLGNVDGSLEHSTRFTLVDRKSRIRGYYETSEKESLPQLIRDIQKLAKERF